MFGKNHMPVEGKTILLTGATEGLGRAAAIQLAEKGANIVIVARNLKRLEDTLAALKSAAKFPTQRFHAISADVSKEGYAKPVVEEVLAWSNNELDIVWCVAGVSSPLFWHDERAPEALRYNMNVNFYGSAEMSHAVLREWLSPEKTYTQPKHLIFNASVLALYAVAGYAPYNPTKWAMRGLADTIAQEVMLFPNNPVQVHVIYPATILSAGYERECATTPDVTKAIEEGDPQQTPEEVARYAIRGLEKGYASVTTTFTGSLLAYSIKGGSLRNNWFVDTIGAVLMAFIWFVVQIMHHGILKGWHKKHGHPWTWPKKEQHPDRVGQ